MPNAVATRQQSACCYLQADETRVQVLTEDGKTAQSQKWMWVTRGGPPDIPSVLFAYDSTAPGRWRHDCSMDLRASCKLMASRAVPPFANARVFDALVVWIMRGASLWRPRVQVPMVRRKAKRKDAPPRRMWPWDLPTTIGGGP